MNNVINATKRFQETNCEINSNNQNQIIMEYAPLIKFLAKKVASKINYSVEVDELVNCGVLGLIDAIEKFDNSKENKFKTYAEFRIRGAMLDYLRELDWTPRSVRDKAKNIERTSADLQEKLGRTPNGEEIAGALGMSSNEYHHYVQLSKTNSVVSIDEIIREENTRPKLFLISSTDGVDGPTKQLEQLSAKETIANAIKALPEREQTIVSLYYFEELNLKQIGEVLEISESRASQLHAKAIKSLKTVLADFDDEDSLAIAA
jgi:RNA polymerase sigma factor for flagellar operon FliA